MGGADESPITAAMAILHHDPAKAAIDQAKRTATLQARAALKGFELVRLGDGSYVAAKPAWAMHTTLPDLTSVEAWLERVGA